MVVVDWEYGVNVGRWDVEIDEAEMLERVHTINTINNNFQQCISFNWYMKILILKLLLGSFSKALPRLPRPGRLVGGEIPRSGPYTTCTKTKWMAAATMSRA